MAWLKEIPMAVVAAHLEMLDRLQAEEAISAGSAHAFAVNTARAKRAPSWIGRQWGAWSRRLRKGGRRGRAANASPADLQAVGIAVVKVPKRG